jgi:hypothetical protein
VNSLCVEIRVFSLGLQKIKAFSTTKKKVFIPINKYCDLPGPYRNMLGLKLIVSILKYINKLVITINCCRVFKGLTKSILDF